MSSLVLELQKELFDTNCDILQALRKAHVIASKLQLNEFDEWIQNELNGYNHDDKNIPAYRQVKGTLKANNPRRGWIPVVITDPQYESLVSSMTIVESVSTLIDIEKKSKKGRFYYFYPPDISMKICKAANAPIYMEVALFINTIYIVALIDKIRNCVLEWTLELERKGILGNDMSFNEQESISAKQIPQQIINYNGTVVNGNVGSSQISSGNNNRMTYNLENELEFVKTIKETLNQENISPEDKDSCLEMLDELSGKIEAKKKPGIIKSAFVALKDFLVDVGANITANLIAAEIQTHF